MNYRTRSRKKRFRLRQPSDIVAQPDEERNAIKAMLQGKGKKKKKSKAG